MSIRFLIWVRKVDVERILTIPERGKSSSDEYSLTNRVSKKTDCQSRNIYDIIHITNLIEMEGDQPCGRTVNTC